MLTGAVNRPAIVIDRGRRAIRVGGVLRRVRGPLEAAGPDNRNPGASRGEWACRGPARWRARPPHLPASQTSSRSEEHTSELQSRQYLVCRLLLEKKKANRTPSGRLAHH